MTVDKYSYMERVVTRITLDIVPRRSGGGGPEDILVGRLFVAATGQGLWKEKVTIEQSRDGKTWEAVGTVRTSNNGSFEFPTGGTESRTGTSLFRAVFGDPPELDLDALDLTPEEREAARKLLGVRR